ncbi:hypothetical protein GCM10009799_34360 [Nocardiopsis rhodophaea]|uniref:Uncharacterized protein n=1 Tax=Nocardiopsis rhodophaea TaxID=280238 RepID=A0ABN2TCD5_9ACTN
MTFDRARHVADAVLFEGYLLYPYRASAVKNQVRWQFGVLAPPGARSGEPAYATTECLVETGTDPVLDLRVRFLRVRTRAATREDARAWDEGATHEVDACVPLDGGEDGREVPFTVAGGTTVEDGVTYTGNRVDGLVTVAAEPLPGPYGLVRVNVRVANRTAGHDPESSRDEMLRSSMVATHTLLRVSGGAFVSLLEPPEWAASAVATCRNEHTWPVLVGEPGSRDLMLSSPIILYDYPEVAPESPADLCDATEIDEILTLRTMALTDDERREARATDPRAARIVDGAAAMPPEMLDRLHGALRYLDGAVTPGGPGTHAGAGPDQVPGGAPDLPWWDPGQDAAVDPDTDTVTVPGGTAAKGSRVLLRPGRQRADAQDMFLRGRTATVAGVFHDVDGGRYLAVTLDDDLGADLHQWHGRYLYFTPDEVEMHGGGS